MSFREKNYPLTGSDMVFRMWKRKKEAATFKGTLLGIVVSFFIIIFLAYLLNLSPLRQGSAGQAPAERAKNSSAAESASRDDGGPVSFFRMIFDIKTAQAAVKPVKNSYEALAFISSAQRPELLPGEEATYRIGFKNTGLKAWLSTGANFVSIYTYSPKYRKSIFNDGWIGASQPAKLQQKKVNPGEIGYFEFKIKAPKDAGVYSENFRLAAENKAWLVNSDFTIPITVAKKIAATSVKLASDPPVAPPLAPKPFQASLISRTGGEKIQAKAGEVVDMDAVFKNTGTTSWDLYGLIAPTEALEGDGSSVFYLSTWSSGHEPVASGIRVNPGDEAKLSFALKAPEAAGTYAAKFKLVANYDHEVAGGEVEIPIYVTDESAGRDLSGRVAENINMSEPTIEVGLEYFDATSPEAVELTSDNSYQATDKNGNLVASFSANESIRITYDFTEKLFTLQNARMNLQTTGELHFKGLANNTVFTILSMSRPYQGGWNDNKYRDEIILRYADTTGRLWTVNHLPMEHYLWGIAETSNISPLNYIKSIIVAARTYAAYHFLNPYKYNGYFTLQATTADQLYRGYNSETRSSRVVQAVNETDGQVVTYQKDIVVTPYFGHSDGKTRSWSQVFGGADKPWLQPVAAPYDVGLEMWGHGVGMSANDAYGHAKTDLWDYTKILKYYYNGIEVSKVY